MAANDEILSTFDVTLTDDIVKDVATTGKTFKKEIWEQGTSETGEKSLLGCIFLDKSEQDVVRLRFTVYKDKDSVAAGSGDASTHASIQAVPTTGELSIQTLPKDEETQASQTQPREEETQASQTERHQGEGKASQTPSPNPTTERPIQTESKVEECRSSQTEQRQGEGKSSQTASPNPTEERPMQTDAKQEACRSIQTDSKDVGKVGQTQTLSQTSSAFAVQTDAMILLDPQQQVQNDSQTDKMVVIDPANQCEMDTQTEEMIVIDPEDQCEMDCQTRTMIIVDPEKQVGSLSQTEPLIMIEPSMLKEGSAQTVAAKLRSIHAQTTVRKFADTAMQAAVTSKAMHQQTTILTYKENAIQASAEIVSRDQQTDIKVLNDGSAQTDTKKMTNRHIQVKPTSKHTNMQTVYMGIEKEVQSTVETCVTEAQTDIKEYKDTDTQVCAETKSQEMQTSREFLHETDCQTDDMIIIDPEDQSENDCQTDALIMVQPEDQREIETQTEDCKVIYPALMTSCEVQTDVVRVSDPQQDCEMSTQTMDVYVRDDDARAEFATQTEPVDVRQPRVCLDSITQTTMVWVTGLQQDPRAPPSEVSLPPAFSEEPPYLNPPGGTEEDLPPPELDALPQLEHEIPVATNTPQKHRMDFAVIEEKYVQTDPVTIIVGDSSNLIEQLKLQMAGGRGRGTRRRATGTGRGRGSRGGRGGRGGMYPGYIKQEMGPPMLTAAGGQGSLDDADNLEMPVLDAEGNVTRGGRGGRARTRGGGAKIGRPKLYPDPDDPDQSKPFNSDDDEGMVPQNVPGTFNCPYCTTIFKESVELYRHLQTHHNLPKAINRRTRRKGTIILTDSGERIIENGGPAKPGVSPRRKRPAMYPKREDFSSDEDDEAPGNGQQVTGYPPVSHTQQNHSLGQPIVQQLVNEGLGEGLEEGEEIEVLIEFAQDENQSVDDQPPALINQSPASRPAVGNGNIVNDHAVAISPLPAALEAPPAGKRAFSCPFCPKTFPKSSALYVHLQNTHRTERPSTTRTKRPRAPKKTNIVIPPSEPMHEVLAPGVTEQDFLAPTPATVDEYNEEEEEEEEYDGEDSQVFEVVVAAEEEANPDAQEELIPASVLPLKRPLPSVDETVPRRATRRGVAAGAEPPTKRGRRK